MAQSGGMSNLLLMIINVHDLLIVITLDQHSTRNHVHTSAVYKSAKSAAQNPLTRADTAEFKVRQIFVTLSSAA